MGESKTPEHVADFMADLRAATHPHPFDRRSRLLAYDVDGAECYAVIVVRPWDGMAYIEEIGVSPKSCAGHGVGSSALRLITDLADARGVTLALTPVPIGHKRLNRAKLTAWYKRRGFAGARGDDTLVRLPH